MTETLASSTLGAAHLIRRSLTQFARRLRELRVPHGVSASKLSVLGQLHRAGGPLTASELAQRERLQPQSLTRIIAELEAKALIERTQSQADRRQLDIAISQAGVELLAVDARRQNQWLAEAMANRLTPAERAILALAGELLDRMADHELVDPDAPERPRSAKPRRSTPKAGPENPLFEGQVLEEAIFRDCAMARTRFEDVDLGGALFSNVRLARARLENIDLSGAIIDHANIDGLTIFGHDVQALIRAEIARRREGD